MATIDTIQNTLTEMQTLLNTANQTAWLNKLNNLATELETVSPTEIKNTAKKALKMYGGMGSLSDVILYVQGKPAKELNNQFDTLRSDLYQALTNLITT